MKYLSAAVVALILSFGIGNADARGVAIYNTGEDIIEVSDIKSDIPEEAQAKIGDLGPDAKIGIVFERFGLFWMDIWRWDARWVAFSDSAYIEFEKEELEKYAEGELSKPFTMTLPPGLIVLILGIIGFVLLAIFGKDDEDEEGGEMYAEQAQQPGQAPQQPGQPGQPGYDPNKQG